MSEEDKALTVLEQFYPDTGTQVFCENAAARIDEVNSMRVRFSVRCRLEVGHLLNEVAARLPHGQYGPWLRWRLNWSEESTRRWRAMAHRVEQNPQILESLHKFRSVTAAEEYACLPEHVQEQVVEAEAWTWSEYRAVCWRAKMLEHLADEGLDRERRYGDVLHAIEEARADPALTEAAEGLYLENREPFALLADRDPVEMDVEVRIAPRAADPGGDPPRAQLVERDEGLWLCRMEGDGEFRPVAPIRAHVVLWPGPTVLAAFPRTENGPAAESWQDAGVDAVVARLGASTLGSVYGDVL